MAWHLLESNSQILSGPLYFKIDSSASPRLDQSPSDTPAVSALTWNPEEGEIDTEPLSIDASPLAERVADWLRKALDKPEVWKHPDFPLAPEGTPFQRRVWKALLDHTPTRGTLTYGALAKAAGTAPRAVGQAMRRNPIPLLIPCHRVVAANGLGGYQGRSNSAFKRAMLGL
ncbi:MAG: methylated-DNA--[protein]-cysteine S-methyltransferase [Magnetococcales bacterium]|nr:methylated-DNA--[protein]-cysteine S-methyltransferase [Magnetococcales bacterium]